MKYIRRLICTAIAGLLLGGGGMAADDTEPFVWRAIENNAFVTGEYLRFRIRWGLIVGGYATLQVNTIEVIHARPSFVLISRARSNNFFDVFFKVRDLHKSWVDVESFCTHRFFKNIREGGFRRWRNVTYNHPAGSMRIDKGGGEIHTASIPPFVQDMLSALYVIRVSTLTVGSTVPIAVNTTGKNWELVVNVLRKERIKGPLGTFDCIVVEPHLVEEGLFDAKGRIWVWLTDDTRHLPVKMKSKIAVGSITAELVGMEPLPEDNTYDTDGFDEP